MLNILPTRRPAKFFLSMPEWTNTHVFPKLPSRELCLELKEQLISSYFRDRKSAVESWRAIYHLINLLQLPALDFWQKEEYPERCNASRRKPDETVSWAPVKSRGVDEVRRCVLGEPCHQEPDRGRETKGVAAEALGGDFATGEPSVGCNGSLYFKHWLVKSR